ncbi:MAG: WecB/TagA/CpsF family glycosyltransferase [Patescibacteria group bacterium]
METIGILGVEINKITLNQAVKEIEKFLLSGKQHFIVTPNPEFLMAGQKDKEFKKILNEADLAIPDGIGLLWAATLQKSEIRNPKSETLKKIRLWARGLFYGLALMVYPKYCQKVLPERVTGVDLVWEIARLAEEKNFSVFLLGGEGGIAVACALKLKQRYPRLRIVGAERGIQLDQISNFPALRDPRQSRDKFQISNKIPKSKFQINPTLPPLTLRGGVCNPTQPLLKIRGGKEGLRLNSRINQAKPDILLVAFGQVKQEKWIYNNLKKMPNVKVAMGVGGAFDFIAGQARRAPKLSQKLGLEWFWRLIFQPWRFNRIMTATFRFARTVINDIIKKNSLKGSGRG